MLRIDVIDMRATDASSSFPLAHGGESSASLIAPANSVCQRWAGVEFFSRGDGLLKSP
jgi:hypothetical protein